ncbi:MAG: hypothetical protein P8Y62_05785 [candidate division WOR-3 bacterium]|jgi:hypothetical protein
MDKEKEYVIYNGVRMVKGWPEEIKKAQKQAFYGIFGKKYERIKYGNEKDDWGADDHPCGDCGVIKGQYHVKGCDIEQCPCCGEQVLSCDCEYEGDEE